MKNLRVNILIIYVPLASYQSKGQTAPPLSGKLIFHSYSDYNNWDSQLYLLDFSSGSVNNISTTWNIDHEMNAHFSPDGTKIVFMGDLAGDGIRNWDIFLWTVGDPTPVNLTNLGGRDEDPKFSPDGLRIVFKSDGDLWQMDLTGNRINNVTNTASIEESMPFYTADGNSILYAPGVGATSDVYQINTDGTGNHPVVAVTGVQEYFPITRDNNSFLYTAWQNASAHQDQIYMYDYSTGIGTRLPFNDGNYDFSDSYAVGNQYIVFASDKPGGKGNYDLYIADITTGQIWSLDNYNPSANTSFQDLGPCYFDSASLPLTIINLQVTKRNDVVSINWNTVQESNVNHFIVERSNDCILFTPIEIIPSQNKSSLMQTYFYQDVQPSDRQEYYRIKQVDNNGSYYYSSIVKSETLSEEENWVEVFPNPATSQEINIQFRKTDSDVLLELTDLLGHKYHTEAISSDQCHGTYVLHPGVTLSPGIYYLSLFYNNKIVRKKITVL